MLLYCCIQGGHVASTVLTGFETLASGVASVLGNSPLRGSSIDTHVSTISSTLKTVTQQVPTTPPSQTDTRKPSISSVVAEETVELKSSTAVVDKSAVRE